MVINSTADAIVKIQTILTNSGLLYTMSYNPETKSYSFYIFEPEKEGK